MIRRGKGSPHYAKRVQTLVQASPPSLGNRKLVTRLASVLLLRANLLLNYATPDLSIGLSYLHTSAR